MSEIADKTNETSAASAPSAAKSKGGALPMILGFILPALLAGAGSYGGARAAGRAAGGGGHGEAAPAAEVHPPGPTIALDPFLVSISDAAKRSHPMKLTVAVEFEGKVKEDTLKAYTPRIRDAVLGHMRTMAFEDAVDQQHTDKLRSDLLERCRKAGAVGAERVLITDLVSQ
jgi:flagellar FliL protein